MKRGFGVAEFDDEGRYLEARFGDLSVVSLYLPSGSRRGPSARPPSSASSMAFMPWMQGLRRKKRQFVLCGDWNIAHKPIDLRNWKSNQKNSGFLPEERAWLDRLFGEERLGRQLPRGHAGARPVHLVVEPRPGLGEERRLAHRLPGREPRPRRRREARRDLQGAALLGPRAADRGLRPVSAGR